MSSVKSIELENFDIEQLKDLQDRIAAEIKRRSTQQKKDVLAKLKAMAAASGYSLEELMAQGGMVTKPATRTVAPKYRHPADASQTWTGRGKQPRWVAEQLASGKSLDDLRI